MPNSPRRPVLSFALRLGPAGLAASGVLMTAPTAAQAQVVPLNSPLTSTATATAPTTAPAAAPRLTARQKAELRRERREHRREVRQHRRERRHHRHVVHRVHKIEHAFRIAAHQLGDPYVWGATGPDSFDCSGLTSYAYHHAGMRLPRTAAQQATFVRRIPRSELHRGDLVFFDGAGGGYVHHVALFEGWKHGRRIMLDAPHTGAVVRREAIWNEHWFAGTLRLHRH